jgi:NADH-quinone oxidoreductase subunit E
MREREARAAARAAKEAEAGVPPSRAAKPKTDKPETSAGLKTPSPVKASPAAEKRTSAKDAPINRRAANLANPVVEDAVKQRKGPSKRAPVTPKNQSPELLKGRPIGPGGKMQAGEAAAPKGVPSPDGRLAARTASGSARGKDAKPSLDSKDRPAAVARPAKPDDLQLISGVGPKIEATLHSLGIFTYAQVASWKKAERDWVDGYLSFSGRIEREDWVKQAKALAKGGVAEYIRVFGKKPR